jgi:hypothetical protein
VIRSTAAPMAHQRQASPACLRILLQSRTIPCAPTTQEPVREHSLSPRSPTQSSGKPSILPPQSRCRRRLPARFNRKGLKHQGKRAVAAGTSD